MTTPWHASPAQIDAYLTDRVDQVTASSIDAHVAACPSCRGVIAEREPAADLAASWARIEARIDAEPTSLAERLGARVGLRPDVVRLLAPTHALRVVWIAAGASAFVVAAALARSGIVLPGRLGRTGFLTVAPLIPLAAVASTLEAASEPTAELARTAPMSRLRIGALRAGTVLVVTMMCGLAASTVVPGPWTGAVAWLCPALALSGLGATLARRVVSSVAIGIVGAAWVGLVSLAAIVTDDGLAAFRPTLQAAYLAVATLAALGWAADPTGLDPRRVR